MPLYKALEPVSYVSAANQVIHIVQVGSIFAATEDQAATIPESKIEYIGSGTRADGPRANIVVYDNLATFPLIGQAFNIYMAQDTGLQYRWVESTSSYVDLSLAKASVTDLDQQVARRPGGYSSGLYYPCNSISSSTSASLGFNNLRVTPWVVVEEVDIDRLLVEHTVAGDAGTEFRAGVYADDGNGKPATLLLDAGTVSMSGSAAVQQIAVDLTLQRGIYWVGGALQGGSSQPTVRTVNAATLPPMILPATSITALSTQPYGWVATGHSGVLPSSATWTSSAGAVAKLGFRVA